MKKKILTLTFLLAAASSALTAMAQKTVYNHVFAPGEGLVNRTETQYREEICLNGYWDFQPVATPKDFKYGSGKAPALTKPVEGKWDKTRIKIPSPWNVNDFAYRNLEGPDHRNYPSYPQEWNGVKMAWMRKTVDVPADWSRQSVRLYFEAVAGCAEVYVNGQKAGENFDLMLPFSFDVTDMIKPGQKNEILVGVRSQWLFEDRSTVGRRILPGGSMWTNNINGIWQDVYLLSVPKVRVSDVYVKPLVSKGVLEVDVTVSNSSAKAATVKLDADIYKWLNLAGTDVNSAPVPAWELGAKLLTGKAAAQTVEAGWEHTFTMRIPVKEGALELWSPEHPNLNAMLVCVTADGKRVDTKYQRFGWREWTFDSTRQCLNGKPYPLRGDSWHFMGIPQMTRRYAYAWYRAIKDMNGNAVRLHAMVYPRLYMEMADEMGICVLGETGNWASDGGPKLDSDTFWQHSRDHLARFVRRDRNYPSVFGWSISNENKPVILYVFMRPDLMEGQKKAWAEWRDIVRANDPTRPWISSDGEDDGDGILPATVGHYGDLNSMKRWRDIGKPWGIGETSMAYYGTPEQIAKVNGERAYESMLGRMEGVATECYGLIKDMREMGASYSCVFNMAWYGLQPLPLGKHDITTAPTMDDGIFFPEYVEGRPGVQPERMGPYCTTFNPGYDPSLPLYRPWPMFEALRAVNAGDKPAWSEWAEADKAKYAAPKPVAAKTQYTSVVFVGDKEGRAYSALDAQGVIFSKKVKAPENSLIIIDGTQPLSAADAAMVRKNTAKGADVFVWGLTPETAASVSAVLPAEVSVDKLKRSSFLPEQKSLTYGLNNSDFYFCELQQADAAEYTIKGKFVDEGDVLLRACRTDWRTWNKRAEEMKTAAVLRSENECTASLAVIARMQHGASTFYVSTLTDFANSDKGFNTLRTMLATAGVACRELQVNVKEVFFLRDNHLVFPVASRDKMSQQGDKCTLDFYVYSNRPLDDLFIEPNVPKLTLKLKATEPQLTVGGKAVKIGWKSNNETEFKEIPLKQGWNKLTLTIPAKCKGGFEAHFKCDNRAEYMPTLKAAFTNPEDK